MNFVETSFKIDSKSRIASLISWKRFRSDRDFMKTLEKIKENGEYPKMYTETDEEWTWETLNFWPEWIDAKEMINYLKS